MFTLPYNKFNVFISKLITILSFIYGVLATQHLLWILEALIIKGFTGIDLSEIIDIINYSNSINYIFMGISIYPLEVFVNYVIDPILAVIVLFTGVIIHKSFDKIGGFIGLSYVVVIILIYILLSATSMIFTDELLKYHILYYIAIAVLSLIISYRLLNKRIHV